MTTWNQRWGIIRRLGEGGQGTVDLVVTNTRRAERDAAMREIVEGINFITPQARTESDANKIPAVAEQFAAAVEKVNRPHRQDELGALKQLHVPNEKDERAQAMARFSAELRALRELRDETAVLRLLDSDETEGWAVTEYHPAGTLSERPKIFVGDALGALRAFEPLVASIVKIHARNAVHRDIKPPNIFVSERGDLVFGDFGIVFWAGEQSQRLTETYERVGSRDWMAPWANRGRRLADINPTFDLFPLGKLLWAMISGQRELPYWYWQDDEHNLEKLFPGDPAMYWVNSRILANTVVEREAQCIGSAKDLHARINEVISIIERGGQRVDAERRPCRVCGIGHYQDFRGAEPQIIAVLRPDHAQRLNQAQFVYKEAHSSMTIRVQTCDHCGHVEFFQFADGRAPSAWTR